MRAVTSPTPVPGSDQSRYRCTLRIKPHGRAIPFGSFDTPVTSGTPLAGSLPSAGWALDDIGIDRVEIWRDRAPGKARAAPVAANGKIFIADALFVTGARPDVEGAFGDHPFHRAPDGGTCCCPGACATRAMARSRSTHSPTTWRATWSSWARSQSSSATPRRRGRSEHRCAGVRGTMSGNGVQLRLGVDAERHADRAPSPTATCTYRSIPVPSAGEPTVTCRTDIQGAFPGFSNGGNSGGNYLVDTTTMTNGTHQIGW